MFLSFLLFVFTYVFFLSAAAFKLFLLTFSLFAFLVATHFIVTVTTLTSLFSQHITLYQFDFLNLSYSLLFDGITLYFILLTLLLFILCILLG